MEYPIDTKDLKKGDYIPPETIEHAFGINRTHPHYGFKVMALRKYIKMRLEERGLNVVTKSEKLGIRILEDDASVEHTAASFRSGIRRAARAHDDAMKIDVSKLDTRTADRLDRNLDRQGRMMQALMKAKGKLKLPKKAGEASDAK